MSVVLLALPFALLVLAAIIAAIVVLRRRGAFTFAWLRGGLRRVVGAFGRRVRGVFAVPWRLGVRALRGIARILRLDRLVALLGRIPLGPLRGPLGWLRLRLHLLRVRLFGPRGHGRGIEPGSGVRRIPGPVGAAPLPVVLVHGFFGFDRIGVPGVRLHYFRGIAQHLESQGCHAHAVRLPAVASVPERAKILVDKIAALPHDRVDIIAHSLGGLDARYALAHLGLASKVRSLVTVGTPHRGTPIADLAITGAIGVARKAIGAVGIRLQALDWLSPAALARFNEQVKDAPGVRYACVVAGIRERGTPISLALVPAHAYLRRIVGPNDGLVPIASQYWGEVLAEIEADHWEQVGWRTTMRGSFDALAMYAWVVARLGDAPVLAKAS